MRSPRIARQPPLDRPRRIAASFGLDAIAGLAGAVKALVFQFATLTDVAWQMSGEVILMTLLGGIGTMVGPIVGAGLVVSLENTLATSEFPVTIATGLIFMICVPVPPRHRRRDLCKAPAPRGPGQVEHRDNRAPTN